MSPMRSWRAQCSASFLLRESSNATIHEYYKETQAPVVGFREANTAGTNTPGQEERVTVNLKILEAKVEADKAVAKAYPRRKGGVPAYMAKKSSRYLAAGFHAAERQFIYGTASDSDGFVGFAENDGLNSISDGKGHRRRRDRDRP